MSRNFLEISRNFLEMSRKFLEISRKFLETSRKFPSASVFSLNILVALVSDRDLGLFKGLWRWEFSGNVGGGF